MAGFEANLILSRLGVAHFRPNLVCPDLGCPISGQIEKMAKGPGKKTFFFDDFPKGPGKKTIFFGSAPCFLPLLMDLGPPHAYGKPILQKKINLIELL